MASLPQLLNLQAEYVQRKSFEQGMTALMNTITQVLVADLTSNAPQPTVGTATSAASTAAAQGAKNTFQVQQVSSTGSQVKTAATTPVTLFVVDDNVNKLGKAGAEAQTTHGNETKEDAAETGGANTKVELIDIGNDSSVNALGNALQKLLDRVTQTGEKAVINMSLSVSAGGAQTQRIQDIIKKLNDKGVIVVVSAGNDGKKFNNRIINDAKGNLVGKNFEVEALFKGQLASYSSLGNVQEEIQGSKVGDNKGNGVQLQGTSFAAPRFAGFVAQLVGAGLSYDQIAKVAADNGRTLTQAIVDKAVADTSASVAPAPTPVATTPPPTQAVTTPTQPSQAVQKISQAAPVANVTTNNNTDATLVSSVISIIMMMFGMMMTQQARPAAVSPLQSNSLLGLNPLLQTNSLFGNNLLGGFTGGLFA